MISFLDSKFKLLVVILCQIGGIFLAKTKTCWSLKSYISFIMSQEMPCCCIRMIAVKQGIFLVEGS